MFRRPEIGLAEIAWRWSFGAAVVLLAAFGCLEFLATLPVSGEDLFLLRTRHPFLVSQALAHIFRGSGARAAEAAVLSVLALAAGWIAVASCGRAITLAGLRDYFRQRGAVAGTSRWRLRTLAGLNALRATVALAAGFGGVAGFLLAGAVSPDSDPSPGAAFLVFTTILLLVAAAWLLVNWLLTLAAVMATGEQKTMEALAGAAGLCRERGGAVAAASTWFGLAHVVALVVASSVVAFPLAFAGVLPAGVVMGGVLLVALMYFFVADFLYVGRLAAYLYIAERPAEVPKPLAEAPPSSVDGSELILSDVPPIPEAGG
ncbi:MAG TPA: hypothetical protein VLV49_09480 [Terriglobales bacterium]|nr:hypothetical protein [Terriglobales bacterium]